MSNSNRIIISQKIRLALVVILILFLLMTSYASMTRAGGVEDALAMCNLYYQRQMEGCMCEGGFPLYIRPGPQDIPEDIEVELCGNETKNQTKT